MEQISVIVPIYKVEKYVKRCVDSILNQSYPHLEIILVDDGSPDNCGKICDAYALQDSRVKVIHKINGGLSDARNAGIEAAHGEYLAFVDSDDWLDFDMFEQLYRLCKEHNADIAECSYRNIYNDCIKEETICSGEIIEGDGVDAIEGILDWNHFKPVAWNKLYHKDIIGSIRYPKGKLHEDEFTTYQYFAQAKKLVYLDVSKYNYDRSRTDSITGDTFKENNLDVCFAMRERRDFLQKTGFGGKKLSEKNDNVYCWVLLEKLYCCYKNNIKGDKLNAVLQMVKEDLKYYESRPVPPEYIKQFQLIQSKGLTAFGKYRDQL